MCQSVAGGPQLIETLATAPTKGRLDDGPRKLREGNIVGLDLGCVVDGFFGDAARTVAVGTISEEASRLMKVTKESLFAGVDTCHPGKRVGDIGGTCPCGGSARTRTRGPARGRGAA